MPTIAYPTFVPRSEDTPRFVLPPGEGIRLLRLVEYESFVDVLGEHLFGLVVGASADADTKARLRRLLLAVPDAHLVVVLLDGHSSRGLDVMAGPRLVVLPDATDSRGLVRAVRRAWFEGRVERIRRAARQRTPSAVVRCAVSRILNERITEKDPEPEEVTIHRTLKTLAGACGTNRETLRRASRRCSLDLSGLMYGWRVALALRERFIETDLPSKGVWRAIARRCGYEGESGLRGLMKHELGAGLPEFTLDHLQELLDRLEAHVPEGGCD